MNIKITPEIGTEAYQTIKQLEHFGYEFSGPGFWVSGIGFRGFLLAKKGSRWVQIDCTGSDAPVFTIKHPPQEPDADNAAKEHDEAAQWAEQPAPYE